MSLSFALQTFDKVIVVDWSCPQNSGEYAASEGASVIYKYGERFFCGSKAKNYGAKLVTTNYVCFLDADSICMPGLKEELASLKSPDSMILSCRALDGSDVNDTVGFLVCKTDSFWNVGGFDEEMWKGWGHEDIHLRGKLLLDEGLKVVRLSGMVLGAIPHSNELRSENRSAPIVSTAIKGHKVLVDWFASKGIEGYPNNPKVKDIVFVGSHPAS